MWPPLPSPQIHTKAHQCPQLRPLIRGSTNGNLGHKWPKPAKVLTGSKNLELDPSWPVTTAKLTRWPGMAVFLSHVTQPRWRQQFSFLPTWSTCALHRTQAFWYKHPVLLYGSHRGAPLSAQGASYQQAANSSEGERKERFITSQLFKQNTLGKPGTMQW